MSVDDRASALEDARQSLAGRAPSATAVVTDDAGHSTSYAFYGDEQ